jgi:hypothetical protein
MTERRTVCGYCSPENRHRGSERRRTSPLLFGGKAHLKSVGRRRHETAPHVRRQLARPLRIARPGGELVSGDRCGPAALHVVPLRNNGDALGATVGCGRIPTGAVVHGCFSRGGRSSSRNGRDAESGALPRPRIGPRVDCRKTAILRASPAGGRYAPRGAAVIRVAYFSGLVPIGTARVEESPIFLHRLNIR